MPKTPFGTPKSILIVPFVFCDLAMNVSKVRLLSNNPKKRVGLISYGIEMVESVPIEINSNQHNKFYLETKRDKMGHSLKNLNG